MALLVGIVAFFMAFAALWFTSEALRRLEARNDAFLSAHHQGIAATLVKNEKVLNTLSKRLEILETEVQAFRDRHDEARETLATLERRARETRSESAEDGDRDVA